MSYGSLYFSRFSTQDQQELDALKEYTSQECKIVAVSIKPDDISAPKEKGTFQLTVKYGGDH